MKAFIFSKRYRSVIMFGFAILVLFLVFQNCSSYKQNEGESQTSSSIFNRFSSDDHTISHPFDDAVSHPLYTGPNGGTWISTVDHFDGNSVRVRTNWTNRNLIPEQGDFEPTSLPIPSTYNRERTIDGGNFQVITLSGNATVNMHLYYKVKKVRSYSDQEDQLQVSVYHESIREDGTKIEFLPGVYSLHHGTIIYWLYKNQDSEGSIKNTVCFSANSTISNIDDQTGSGMPKLDIQHCSNKTIKVTIKPANPTFPVVDRTITYNLENSTRLDYDFILFKLVASSEDEARKGNFSLSNDSSKSFPTFQKHFIEVKTVEYENDLYFFKVDFKFEFDIFSVPNLPIFQEASNIQLWEADARQLSYMYVYRTIYSKEKGNPNSSPVLVRENELLAKPTEMYQRIYDEH